jgi:hypothetical protein
LPAGLKLDGDVAARIERRARAESFRWSYFDVVAIPEKLTIDLRGAAHHRFGLSPVGEKIKHTAVFKELIHVVEVPTAPPVNRRARRGGELLGQGASTTRSCETS